MLEYHFTAWNTLYSNVMCMHVSRLSKGQEQVCHQNDLYSGESLQEQKKIVQGPNTLIPFQPTVMYKPLVNMLHPSYTYMYKHIFTGYSVGEKLAQKELQCWKSSCLSV